MNICVFCSANEVDKKYIGPARELATLIASGKHTLVYGGSEYGLMKIMADGVQQGGSKIIGVSTEFYKTYARKNADEMIITQSLGERRATMLERADVLVLMAGGLGTLDELTEVLELKKQNQHNKPVIVLNTADFYGGLKIQLQRMADEGFLPTVEQEGITIKSLDQYIQFANTPQDVMDAVAKSTT